MTRDEILNLRAGVEMDEAIIRVHGFPAERCECRFSEDIRSAWLLFESLPPSMFGHELSLGRVGKEWGVYYDAGSGREMFVACGETAPMAICRAKLLLAMEDGDAK